MTESDESLVSRAVTLKDTAAFGELVRRYEQKILLLQRRLTGERTLAEDLTQETFLRAWQKLGTFNASGSFGGWLASLSYNVFRAHWRKHRRERDDVPIDEMEIGSAEAMDPGNAELARLLAVLKREDQVIMILAYAYGLSNTEVGLVLDMPPGTVKARIHRAKAKIRELIDSPGSAAPPAGEAEGQPEPQPKNTGTRAAAARRQMTTPPWRQPLRPFPNQTTQAGSLTC